MKSLKHKHQCQLKVALLCKVTEDEMQMPCTYYYTWMRMRLVVFPCNIVHHAEILRAGTLLRVHCTFRAQADIYWGYARQDGAMPEVYWGQQPFGAH